MVPFGHINHTLRGHRTPKYYPYLTQANIANLHTDSYYSLLLLIFLIKIQTELDFSNFYFKTS